MTRILLVEDDTGLANATAYALNNEQYTVTIANSLGEASKQMSQTRYELILLDVILPDGTGYDFCKQIRCNSDIPIVFLTACDDEVNIVMGLDIGADDYIIKPFRIKELMSRINAVLRRGITRELKGKIASGDIVVLTLECKVLIRNAEIFLTNMEYKLLLTFLRNPHQVLTRSALLETLWDVDMSFVEDNTLSVYVNRLRSKLEMSPRNLGCIATVRGIGYKWMIEVGRK